MVGSQTNKFKATGSECGWGSGRAQGPGDQKDFVVNLEIISASQGVLLERRIVYQGQNSSRNAHGSESGLSSLSKISYSKSFQWSSSPEQLVAPCPPVIPTCLSILATCLQCWFMVLGWVSSLIHFSLFPSMLIRKTAAQCEMEQDLMALTTPHLISSACLLSMEKLQPNNNQRSEKMQTQENNQRRPNNNNLVIKHSQRSLVPPPGLQIIF